ncbi:MAG: aminopeptidase [Nanoarchaeota archaeon]
METLPSLQWLRKQNLYGQCNILKSTLKKVFSNCLAVKDEKILVVGDKGYLRSHVSSLLAGAYYLAADELKLNAKLIIQNVKPRGQKADDDLINALTDLENGSIIIVNSSDKLGSIGEIGKSFRKYCLKRKFRFVSALSLGDLATSKVNDVVRAIDINYKELQIRQNQIKALLDDASEINITTDNGTDFSAEIKGKIALSSDGDYAISGLGGNLPAGEVYIPPTNNVDGTIIIDGSTRNHKHTNIIKDPIKIIVKQGKIESIEGKEEANLLNRTLDWASHHSKRPGGIRRIGEIGIGFNPNADIIGSTLVDEKALGTAHIGIGSNYWFGGDIYAIMHLDQIFKNPKIEVDGKPLF